MSNEWCTIESDPGVFTELINNIGTKGLQVNEILDLDELSDGKNNVYGVVFLFKYAKNSGYKPNVLTDYDPDLYFAKQTVMNACATQAILGILLNLEKSNIDIGDTLRGFKEFTKDFDHILKGNCIGDCSKIREEHNKFTK